MQDVVQAYYGKELQSTADLKTSACCDADAVPDWLKPLLSRVHPEVSSRYYGCGLVCPPAAAVVAMSICFPSWWGPAARWSVWT